MRPPMAALPRCAARPTSRRRPQAATLPAGLPSAAEQQQRVAVRAPAAVPTAAGTDQTRGPGPCPHGPRPMAHVLPNPPSTPLPPCPVAHAPVAQSLVHAVAAVVRRRACLSFPGRACSCCSVFEIVTHTCLHNPPGRIAPRLRQSGMSCCSGASQSSPP